MTREELIRFEDDIADCFNNAMIKAPVHLYSGNEDQIIDVFKNVKQEDWVFCTWRSHYQCLLKGVPQEQIKKDIVILKQQGITSTPVVDQTPIEVEEKFVESTVQPLDRPKLLKPTPIVVQEEKEREEKHVEDEIKIDYAAISAEKPIDYLALVSKDMK